MGYGVCGRYALVKDPHGILETSGAQGEDCSSVSESGSLGTHAQRQVAMIGARRSGGVNPHGHRALCTSISTKFPEVWCAVAAQNTRAE